MGLQGYEADRWKYSEHYFAAGKQRGALKFYFAFQKKDMPIGV